MFCPFCHKNDSRVLESRPALDSIRRRRECLVCKQRWTTYERYEITNLMVIKRSGRREPFDRGKLQRGLILACSKTGVTAAQIEQIVDEVEIQAQDFIEIESKLLGTQVLTHLKTLNEVAYIRFASVYHRYLTVKYFVQDLARPDAS